MILAEKIIKLREEQGWSQEELAMRLAAGGGATNAGKGRA